MHVQSWKPIYNACSKETHIFLYSVCQFLINVHYMEVIYYLTVCLHKPRHKQSLHDILLHPYNIDMHYGYEMMMSKTFLFRFILLRYTDTVTLLESFHWIIAQILYVCISIKSLNIIIRSDRHHIAVILTTDGFCYFIQHTQTANIAVRLLVLRLVIQSSNPLHICHIYIHTCQDFVCQKIHQNTFYFVYDSNSRFVVGIRENM